MSALLQISQLVSVLLICSLTVGRLGSEIPAGNRAGLPRGLRAPTPARSIGGGAAAHRQI